VELIVVKHALMRRQVSNFRIGFCGACPRLRSWFTARKHGQRHAEIMEALKIDGPAIVDAVVAVRAPATALGCASTCRGPQSTLYL
jgi:hypothetical protein